MVFVLCFFVFFFFSSRRRHTRLQGDWSSDVCSSDLCWLDNLPGTKNDVVAQQILMDCSKYNPYIGEKSDGWFGGKTMSWCIRKYGEDTVSQRAAMIIRAACFKLYENK